MSTKSSRFARRVARNPHKMTVQDYADWLREMDDEEEERYTQMARVMGDDFHVVREGRADLARQRAAEKANQQALEEKKKLEKQQQMLRQREEEEERQQQQAVVDIELTPSTNFRTAGKYIIIDGDCEEVYEPPRRRHRHNNNNNNNNNNRTIVINLVDDDDDDSDMVMDSPPSPAINPMETTEPLGPPEKEAESIDIEEQVEDMDDESQRGDPVQCCYHPQYIINTAYESPITAAEFDEWVDSL